MSRRRGELGAHTLSTLMSGVDSEDMPDGRHHKPVLVRHVEAVQAVDELRAIYHRDFLRMTIEDVEGHGAEYGVAQGGHLLQLIARSSFTAGPVPWTPFVHNQLYHVVRILLAHDLPMRLDQIFDALPFT